MNYKIKKIFIVMLTVAMSLCMLFACGVFSASADGTVAPTETNYQSFNMKEGLQAKLNFNGSTVEAKNAIRFTTTLSALEIDDAIANYDVKVKTIIVKTESLAKLGENDFTKENLGENGIKYQEVIFSENVNMPEVNSDGKYEFKACLYNLKDENFTKELSAISCIEINGLITQYTKTVAKGSLWDEAKAHKDDLEKEYGYGIQDTEFADEYNYVSTLCATYDVTINANGTPYVQTVRHGEKLSQYMDAEFNKAVAKVENFSYATAFNDAEGTESSNAIMTKDTELTAVYGDQGKVLVDGTVVTGVGSKFFDYTTEVVIPDDLGVTEIANSAFLRANRLKKITMPESVIKIGHEAFYQCTGLETVIMPGVEKITVNEGYSNENKVLSCRQFYGCTSLKTVVVGESFELALVSVDTGNNRCFYVEGTGAIPNQVNIYLTSSDGTATLHTEGETNSVQNMLSVNRVYNLNETEKDICGMWRRADGEPKLSEYSSHNYINGVCLNCADEKVTAGLVYSKYDGKDEYYVSDYTGSDTEVYISSTYEGYPVTGIGKSAFYSQYDSSIKKKITKIVMPISVKTIHHEAFFNCKALETIIMPGVTELTTYSAATSAFGTIEKNQFYGCTSLTTIVAGDSLEITAYSGAGTSDKRVFYTDNYTGAGVDVYLSSADGALTVVHDSTTTQNMLSKNVYHLSETRPTDEAKLATTWDYYNGVPTLWRDIPEVE